MSGCQVAKPNMFHVRILELSILRDCLIPLEQDGHNPQGLCL